MRYLILALTLTGCGVLETTATGLLETGRQPPGIREVGRDHAGYCALRRVVFVTDLEYSKGWEDSHEYKVVGS